MKTKYHAAFNLGIKGKRYPRFSAILEEIKKWAPVKNSPQIFEESSILINDNYSLETVVLENMFGISLTTPDYRDPNLLYNVKLAIKDNQHEKEFNVKMSEENNKRIILPNQKWISRPAIVYNLVKNFGAYDDDNILLAKPVNVNHDNLELFADFIKSEDRRYPIIYISRPFGEEEFLIEPHKVSRELVGLANTFYQDGPETIPRELEKLIGESNSCYDGAIKIYWPKYENAFNNIWLKKEVLEKVNFEKKILSVIAPISVTLKGNMSFEEMKVLSSKMKTLEYKKKYEEAHNSRESKHFVESLMEEHNETLDLNEELKQEIDNLKSERYQQEQVISQLNAIIQEMQKLPSNEEENDLKITSYDDILNVYETNFPQSNVIIHPRAKRQLKKCLYENPKLVYDALEWLNEFYLPARKDGDNNLEETCKELLNMEYNANQPDFMRKYEDYNIVHNGKKLFMEEHLKKGTSHDPKTTLRICFHYEDGEIVVGYIGQHPKVSKN